MTPTPFELIVGIIFKVSANPLSLVIISTLSTELPSNVVLVDNTLLPIATTLGAIV